MKTGGNTITYRDCCWLLLVVFCLQFGVAKLVRTVCGGLLHAAEEDYLFIAATQLLAVALPCLVLMLIRGVQPAFVLRCEDGFTWSTAGVSVLAGAAAQPVVSILNMPVLMLVSRWRHFEAEPLVHTPAGPGALLLGLLVVAVLPAFCEELLMRGLVLSSLRGAGGLVSGIVTTVLFALLHNDAANLLVPLLLGGLLCYIVWTTDAVAYAMLAHGAFNAAGMLTDYLFTALGIDGRFYFAVAAVGAVVLVSSLRVLYCRDSIVPRRERHTVRRVLRLFANAPVLLLFAGYIASCWLF